MALRDMAGESIAWEGETYRVVLVHKSVRGEGWRGLPVTAIRTEGGLLVEGLENLAAGLRERRGIRALKLEFHVGREECRDAVRQAFPGLGEKNIRMMIRRLTTNRDHAQNFNNMLDITAAKVPGNRSTALTKFKEALNNLIADNPLTFRKARENAFLPLSLCVEFGWSN